VVWVVVVIAALVFLCWFGNYTAGKYRRIFGQLPAVHEAPKRFYGDEPKREYQRQEYDYCSSATVPMMTCVTAPFFGAKIVR
jgi:hypothetical protein